MNNKTSAVVRSAVVLAIFFVVLFSVGKISGVWIRYGEICMDPFGDLAQQTEPVAATLISTTQVTTTETTLMPSTTQTTVATTQPKAKKKDAYGETYELVTIDKKNWNLTLVSRYRRVKSDYQPELQELLPAYGYGVSLDKRVVPYYEKMYEDAKNDGILLEPYSAYRQYNTQKSNYENRIAYWQSAGYSYEDALDKTAEVILPPGASEHNLGLAVDINGTDYDFNLTKAYRWLSEYAANYGFIQRYDSKKSDITGIVDEPWHWRFVGVEAAKAIKNSDLCLEEYLQTL